MLEQLTQEDFAKHLHENFQVQTDAGPVPVELIEAKKLPSARQRDGQREPFSILYRGPREPAFPQRVYRLENQSMGALELFLVPIGRDDAGMLYEAIFA